MKKLVLLSIFLFPIILGAQNVQLHYDLGEGREYFTSTIEMFKPDEYGATFFFFDLDYNYWDGSKSASLAYFEIARYIALPIDKLSATIQYNDGTVAGFPLGPIWLGGVSYPIDLGFITLSTDVLFRTARGSDMPDGQLTFVWFKGFMDNKINFTGFFDIWSQDKMGEDGKEMVILTEPQLWYNLGKHLAVGGEVEFSKNFISEDFEVKPTLGFKWNF
jgi:hypothetical protein